MDGFANPFLHTIWSHNNNTSEKIYSEDGLDPPVVIPNGEEAIVSSLVASGGMKLNAGSSFLPSPSLVEGRSGCELTNLPLPPIAGTDLFLSNPSIWTTSTFPNPDVSSFKDLGEFINQTPNSFGNMQQLTSFNGPNEGNGLNLTTLSSGSQLSFTQTLQLTQQTNTQIQMNSSNHQLNQTPASQAHAARVTSNTNAGFDGTFKPRPRARRGQATDPHSIAERLRREKITERMKNLQELVPNSNKTDKASMLDEIIEYVKFLQLQVKVLSMSRLGATEAVVPLLTEPQPEGSNGVLSSVSVGSTANISLDVSAEVQDSAAFEREVVQLMESNMTSAMQYLQNKGLCLMPIALAFAISTQKGTRTSVVSAERQNSNPSLFASSLCDTEN